jgi:hypothetical protein
MCADGRLPALKVAGRYIVRTADAEAIAASTRAAP